MSSLTALFTVRKYMKDKISEFGIVQNYLKKTDPTWAHLDWNGAEEWEQILNTEDNEIEILCRDACYEFILSDSVLINLCSYGREKLIANLSNNEIQVFRNAGLLEKLPNDQIVSWWDQIKLIGRRNLSSQLLIQGREAERWTLDEEVKVTSQWGEEYLPIWVGLEGDHYGHDILSYRMGISGVPSNILIEVKSFSSYNNPHFYITRNEWTKALANPSKYLFYIWCTENKTVQILTPKDIEPNIPIDKNLGNWQNVLIIYNHW